MPQLTFSDHSRVFKNYTYVYPVLSRRSQGISLGINLNINNACNWRCIYCQVDGLVRGKPNDIALDKLEYELDQIISLVFNTDFLIEYAPTGLQRLNDICISGNGESTLSNNFLAVVKIIAKLRTKYNITDKVKTILITNGSEFEQQDIQKSVTIISENSGEIWFKIDSADTRGINLINQVNLSPESIAKKLNIASSLCKTYIQTCMFKIQNNNPTNENINNYIHFIKQFKDKIAGILLYSVARNPMLPEGNNISQVSLEFLSTIANKIEQYGINVKYYI